MTHLRVPLFLMAFVVSLSACGGSGSGGIGGSGGSTGSSGATGSDGAGSSGSTASTASSTIAPPKLEDVMPMAGVLHVAWSATTTCDYIDAERKDDQHPTYAAAWEVSGDKTNHMDGAASQDMTYTYRLRCKVGNELSDYSNEMSANPTK